MSESEPLIIRHIRPNNLPRPEPKPDAGAGGSAPPEGVHRDAEPRAVCLAPDVCKTPVGSMLVPVPYQVWGKAEDAQNFATSVYFRGTPAMRFNSVFSKTYGDEPAQDKGGVKSGDRGGKVEPTSHSPTVNIQNSPAVRHRDRVTLNGGNTPGEIVLSRDQASYGSKAAPSSPAAAADEPRGMGGQFYDHSQTLQDLNAAKEKVSEWWHDPSAIGRDAQAAAVWAKSVPGDLKRAGEQAWQWATWDHVKEAPGQVWGWGKDQAQKGWAHGKDVYRKDGVGGLAAAGLALGAEVFNPVEKLKMLELGTKALKEAGALERAAHGAEHALEHAKSGDGGVRITEKKKRSRNPCHHLAKGNPNGKGPFRGGAYGGVPGSKVLGLESHHIPPKLAYPTALSDRVGGINAMPSIQMDRNDHSETSSHGQNGKSAANYRESQRNLLGDGRFRDAVANDYRDARNIARESGNQKKYNEAMREASTYRRCLEKHGLLPGKGK